MSRQSFRIYLTCTSKGHRLFCGFSRCQFFLPHPFIYATTRDVTTQLVFFNDSNHFLRKV